MPFSFKTIWENIRSFADQVYARISHNHSGIYAGLDDDNIFTRANTFSGPMYHNIVLVTRGTVIGTDGDKVVILDGGQYILPTAYHPDGKSKIIFMKNVRSDEVRIKAQSGEYIEGSYSYIISGKSGIVVVSDGDSNWYIVGRYNP